MAVTEDQVAAFFQQLTGFTPYQFQPETILKLLARQDVLLRAPTGAGKTETAIAPFLFAKASNCCDFPNKLIYVVPLRTLANSLRQRAETLIARWSALYPHVRPPVVTLQTGENPEDPRFEGDIIFCTIDQMLSSFLNIPYSVGRGSANVNAGAIFASYLVFDELHLLDPERSFATVLKVLEQVRGISPVLMMSATLTQELVEQMLQTVATIESTHVSAYPSLAQVQVSNLDLQATEGNRCRTFRAIATPLSAQAILDDIHQRDRRRVIVICNTVLQAQKLFRELRDLDARDDLSITLLHSRFLPQDRAQKETHLRQVFAQDWQAQLDAGCQVLIATQVIEAGINITCEVMHTQLCPMNALLQRAGRCARFGGEQGAVYVYRTIETQEAIADEVIEPEPESENPERISFLPYAAETCELTWEVLQGHTASAVQHQPVGFCLEAQWINQVHQVEDQQYAQKRQRNRMEFAEKFNQAVFQGQSEVARDLIRAVDSRNVFVWEPLTLIDFDAPEINPDQLQAFSLPISTLCKVWREVKDLGYEIDWVFRRIEAPLGNLAETYSQPRWTEIKSQPDLLTSLDILVNPRYVFYDDQIGFRISIAEEMTGDRFVSPPKLTAAKGGQYRYHMDTYVGHLGSLWTAWRRDFSTDRQKNGVPTTTTYGSIRAELLAAGGLLIQTKLFPAASQAEATALFENLVFLAVFIHDLGKLQVQWQSVMRGWQAIAHQQFGGRDPKAYLLAHTDADPNHTAQQRALRQYERQYRRPPHAVESAFVGREILQRSLVPLLEDRFGADREQVGHIFSAVVMAAGRHHSAWATGDRLPSQIILHPETPAILDQVWARLGRYLPRSLPLEPTKLSRLKYEKKPFELNRFTPDELEYLQLYLLLARALRLCDQRAVQLIHAHP